MEIEDELLCEAKSYFELNRETITTLFEDANRVLYIDFLELSSHSPELAESLMDEPRDILDTLELALEELEWAPSNAKVMLTNIPEEYKIELDNLRAKNIGKLAFFEGTVLRRGRVRTYVGNSSHECPSCGSIIRKVHSPDSREINDIKCGCGRKGNFKEIEKSYIDFREVYVQDNNSKEGMDVRFEDFFIEDKWDDVLKEGNVLTIVGLIEEDSKKNGNEIQYTLMPLGVVLEKEKTSSLGTIDTLLKQLGKRRSGGFEFEEIVSLVFNKKGYSTRVTQKTGDMGTDIIAENKEEKIAIQCKLNESNIPLSNSVVQKAMGACRSPYEANKLIIVTSSNRVSPKAKEQSKKYQIPVEIWDRKKFMAEYNHHVKDLEDAWDILNKEKESLDEPKIFDIDKITSGQKNYRNQMWIVIEKAKELEKQYGKLISIELLNKKLEGEMSPIDIDEAIDRHLKVGNVFRVKGGFIQIV